MKIQLIFYEKSSKIKITFTIHIRIEYNFLHYTLECVRVTSKRRKNQKQISFEFKNYAFFAVILRSGK
eukprot:TRINITY_DN119_c0_g3_i2.p2 TRINITY_DN119_c0_g3~~TRINITY_DN119_c0_g3_i2.p2  ORF type:complete len:68 (+),score=10.92 TRINITY_DN119_c0_g3_i2:258-461(+)